MTPGAYFIWENTANEPGAVSEPPQGTKPSGPCLTRSTGSCKWLATAQIPTDANRERRAIPAANSNHLDGKDFICNPMGTQPKIIVGSGK